MNRALFVFPLILAALILLPASENAFAQVGGNPRNISISDVALPEGDAGTTSFTFTISRTNSVQGTTTVNWSTADVSATSPSDYAANSGVVTFADGESSKTVTVLVNGDTTVETNETFRVNLTSCTNCTLVDNLGVGTILNDDFPSITIDDVTLDEGDSGTTAFTFTITRSSSIGSSSVGYTTADDTATDPTDYIADADSLTFLSGETSKTVTILVNGDNDPEPDESFNVDLSSCVNCTISDNQGVGTIINDDYCDAEFLAITCVVIDDVTDDEANSPFTFTLTRFGYLDEPTELDYATADGTATAPADYSADSNSLTFASGETSKTVPITVIDDIEVELDETFTVELDNCNNCSFADGFGFSDATGFGTIQDNDDPTISIDDVSLAEGDSGTTAFTFTITRSSSVGSSSVGYDTVGDTANSPTDYTADSDTVSFADGELTKTVTILVNGDGDPEPDETFFVELSGCVDCTISDSQGVGTIENDDFCDAELEAITCVTIDDPVEDEGVGNMIFTLTRTGYLDDASGLDYSTSDGSANAGSDYDSQSAGISFASGVTTQTIAINIIDDGDIEPDETFNVDLSSCNSCTLVDNQGVGTIQDNDDAAITIDDVTLDEGDSGTTAFTFTVSRSSSLGTSSVDYATFNDSATAPSDYTAIGTTTLNFADGELTKTITVLVNGDPTIEPDETFRVQLTSCVDCFLSDDLGIGTILNDDFPSISINDVTQNEGNSGTTPFVFTVTRSSSVGASSVDYATADGTAIAPSDYTAIPTNTLNFADGELTKTITVLVNGDNTVEPNETFFVNLVTCVDCTISDNQGLGTIINDDCRVGGVCTSSMSINDITLNEGDSGTTSFTFTVTRLGVLTGSASVQYTTSDGTAIAPSDYTAIGTTTLNFASGESSKTLTVLVNGDNDVELNETFNVNLSSCVSCTISDNLGLGTILNDDGTEETTITLNKIVEGGGPLSADDFQLTLDGGNVTQGVPNSVSPGTHQIGEITQDGYSFAGVSGAGCPTSLDTDFTITEGANLVCTIFNEFSPDEAFVEIDDVSLFEGDIGTTAFDFTVTRTGELLSDFQVNYVTTPGSASDPSDYTGILSGNVFFGSGETTKTITVFVNGDSDIEPDETFTVDLTSISEASGPVSFSDNQGTGTIQNDDGTEETTITLNKVVEGGPLDANDFQLTLNGFNVTQGVANSVSPGTHQIGEFAQPDYSFAGISGAGCPTDLDTDFTITEGANLTCTIFNEFTGGTFIEIDDVTETEGDSGEKAFTFTVTRTGDLSGSSVVQFATSDDTAEGTGGGGDDYETTAGEREFSPGETEMDIIVNVRGDIDVELDETFFVNLADCVGCVIIDGSGLGTILNDDGVTTITLFKVVEGGPQAPEDFTLRVDGEVVEHGVPFLVEPGTHQISEDIEDYPNYQFSHISGDEGCPESLDTDFDLPEGVTLECSIHNEFSPSDTTITLIKVVEGGPLGPEDFQLTLDGSNVDQGVPIPILPGEHEIGEIAKEFYFPFLTGDEGCPAELDSVFSVPEGSNLTCIIQNSFDGPSSITINKIVEGGPLDANDFEITIHSVSEASFPVTIGEPVYVGDGTYFISEDPEPGYQFDSIFGDEGCPTDLDTEFGLGSSEHIECTIVNTFSDEPPACPEGSACFVINNVSGTEPPVPTTTDFTFTVTRSGNLDDFHCVDWNTEDDTAKAPDDYLADSGTVCFDLGEITQTIPITVRSDDLAEGTETFFVKLTEAFIDAEVEPALTPLPTIILDDTGVGSIQEALQTSRDRHENPTIGPSYHGDQIVENGICIDDQCWTVTEQFHNDFELVEMLTGTHTISNTIYCQYGLENCSHVTLSVSPYTEDIRTAIWKATIQKNAVGDEWTLTVEDPDDYIGDVTFTTQAINDEFLQTSFTIDFLKETPGMQLGVQIWDLYFGSSNFYFNHGIEVNDYFAYPNQDVSYENNVTPDKVCINEDPKKRYTCAFNEVMKAEQERAQGTYDKVVSKQK